MVWNVQTTVGFRVCTNGIPFAPSFIKYFRVFLFCCITLRHGHRETSSSRFRFDNYKIFGIAVSSFTTSLPLLHHRLSLPRTSRYNSFYLFWIKWKKNKSNKRGFFSHLGLLIYLATSVLVYLLFFTLKKLFIFFCIYENIS